MTALSYRGFLMSLAGWIASAILIAWSFFYYYIELYPLLMSGFEKNQFYEVTGSSSDPSNLNGTGNTCSRYELEIPKYIAPFDEYQLTFRISNAVTYSADAKEVACPTLNGYFVFSGEMLTQTAKFLEDPDLSGSEMNIGKEKPPNPPLQKEPIGLSFNKSIVKNMWPISFASQLNAPANLAADQISNVNLRVDIEVLPGKTKDIPLTMHITTMPNGRLDQDIWNMHLVSYRVDFVSKNQEKPVPVPIVFGVPASSCVTDKIKNGLNKTNDSQVLNWFQNIEVSGDVDGTKNANTWPCSQINSLRAFRQTAIHRMLLSPFSNTLIPLVVLVIIYFIDDALPQRPKENFLPRLFIMAILGDLLLNKFFGFLNEEFVMNATLNKMDFFWALSKILLLVLGLRILIIPFIWAVWRLAVFVWMKLFSNPYYFNEQELAIFWDDFNIPIFNRLMRRTVASMLLRCSQEIITDGNPLLKERQRRAFQKVLQIDPGIAGANHALNGQVILSKPRKLGEKLAHLGATLLSRGRKNTFMKKASDDAYNEPAQQGRNS